MKDFNKDIDQLRDQILDAIIILLNKEIELHPRSIIRFGEGELEVHKVSHLNNELQIIGVLDNAPYTIQGDELSTCEIDSLNHLYDSLLKE